MKKLILSLALIASIAIAGTVSAASASATWSANGHTYEVVSTTSNLTWDQANAAATAAGGHLVTITSQAENDFVFDLIDNPDYWVQKPTWGEGLNYGPWIGAYQTDPTSGPIDSTANWNWVTGETWDYTNWGGGPFTQPDDYHGAGSESYAQFFFSRVSDTGPITTTPLWNDLGGNGDGTVSSYVVEYAASPVPVPAAVWLFGSGLLGMIGYSRKKAA